MKQYFVYFLTNHTRTLYTGMTSDLSRRTVQHPDKVVPSFTGKYNINRLAYFERYDGLLAAIEREKQIKGWVRRKKLDLIESVNPGWNDLGETLELAGVDSCISETAYRGRRAEAVLGAPGR